jgi:hypothetical protein
MDHNIVRIVVSILTGFIALTAIGGGSALLVGVEQQRFPLDWLRGTPFKDYTIPSILLAGVVGGSALLACITIAIGHALGPLIGIVAGCAMMGYISGEILLLKQVPPGPTRIEYLYFGLGVVICGLSGYLWLTASPLSP